MTVIKNTVLAVVTIWVMLFLAGLVYGLFAAPSTEPAPRTISVTSNATGEYKTTYHVIR